MVSMFSGTGSNGKPSVVRWASPVTGTLQLTGSFGNDSAGTGGDYYQVVQHTSMNANWNPWNSWSTQDIGPIGNTGGVYTNGTIFKVWGAGNAIGDVNTSGQNLDEFRFVYWPVSGDGSIIARVYNLDTAIASTEAGVMVRSDLTDASTNAFIGVTPGNGGIFSFRSQSSGGTSSAPLLGQAVPEWVMITRAGGTFTLSFSSDGGNWVIAYKTNSTFVISDPCYVGLAVCGCDYPYYHTAWFDNISVNFSGRYLNVGGGPSFTHTLSMNTGDTVDFITANSAGTPVTLSANFTPACSAVLSATPTQGQQVTGGWQVTGGTPVTLTVTVVDPACATPSSTWSYQYWVYWFDRLGHVQSALLQDWTAGATSYVWTPRNIANSYTVHVCVNDGVNTFSGAIGNFIIQPVLPTITSFTPTTGGTGTVVSISGANFTGTTAVQFGGMAAERLHRRQ